MPRGHDGIRRMRRWTWFKGRHSALGVVTGDTRRRQGFQDSSVQKRYRGANFAGGYCQRGWKGFSSLAMKLDEDDRIAGDGV